MNAMRRKKIYEIRARLKDLSDGLRQLDEDLREVRDEEQDAWENLPESIQEGSRGEAMQEAIDKMDKILDGLEDIDLEYYIDDLEEVANI